MLRKLKINLYTFLKWTEKWTKTDMVYLARGGFWLTLGNFISSISGFLLAIAFANLIPKETFGTYKYILSMVSIFTIPTLSGISTALNRAMAQGNEGSFSIALKTRIKWGLLGGLLSLLISIYYFYNNNTNLGFGFLISSFFIPFFDPLILYQSILIGRKDFKHLSKYKTIINTFSLLGMFIVLLLSKNIFFILLTYFLSYSILRLFFLLTTFRKFKPNSEIDPTVITYGKHLSLMNIVVSVAAHVDKILIFHFLGFIDLAIYSFSVALPEQIRSYFKNLNILILPKFSQGSSDEIKYSLSHKVKTYYLLLVPIIIVYFLLAPTIFNLFFPKYLDSINLSRLYILTLLSVPLTSLGLSFLTSQKRKKDLYQINTYGSILKILILFIGIYFFGLTGAIVARISYQAILSLIIYKKIA
jgi:O-antigen/teichoic acid export membrane protein